MQFLLDHIAATDDTAIYPDAGSGSVAALTYVALGLAGESSEVLEKVHVGARLEDIAAEVGDVLWYLSRMHRELEVDPDKTRVLPRQRPDEDQKDSLFDAVQAVVAVGQNCAADTIREILAPGGVVLDDVRKQRARLLGGAVDLVTAAGRVAEIAKKVLRDGGGILSDAHGDKLRAAIAATLRAWLAVNLAALLSPVDTAAANLAKLASRKERGVLQGSGDRR